MNNLVWTEDLNTGIDVIDGQHRRIADSINRLNLVLNSRTDNPARRQQIVRDVIEEVLDYTLSHFTFEETLMEDAGYPFTCAHKRLHEVFREQVAAIKKRHQAGENLTRELHGLLSRWLFSHIRNEDAAYVPVVAAKLGHDSQRSGRGVTLTLVKS